MKRDFLHIGNYHYLVDYYNYVEDNVSYSAEFVMLRNFVLTNNVVCDTDILFIEKNVFDEYIKEIKENNVSSKLSFPISKNKILSFSTSQYDWNDIYTEDSLFITNYNTDEISYGFDVYELLDKNEKSIKIPCNRIRIYHPLTKKSLNGIIYIDNFINNIHFHYICRELSNYDSYSEKEIKVINNTYSEYIDIYFPCIEELFKENLDGTYDVYYKENLDIVASSNNEKFLNKILSNDNLYKYNINEKDQLCPLNLLIHPFRIIEEYNAENENNYNDIVSDDEKHFVKLYINSEKGIDNNYFTYSFNVVIYPFNDINKSTLQYNPSERFNASSLTYINQCVFRIHSNLGFSNGILSVLTNFTYPNKKFWDNLYSKSKTTTPIKEAYKFYNDIDENDYPVFIHPDIQKMFDDIDSITELTDTEKKLTRQLANVSYVDDKLLLNKYKQLKKESIIEEYKEFQEIDQNFIGFKIEIFSDMALKNRIYVKDEKIRLADLDNFAFKINNIFSSWIERADDLIVKVKFIDRYLNIELVSNIVIINKEWFKYMVNDVNIYRSSKLTRFNDNEFYCKPNIIDKKIKDEYNMKFIDLAYNRVYKVKQNNVDNNGNITEEYVPVLPNLNFINNINCVITNETINKNTTDMYNNSTKLNNILYKPIFYKVQDLQNIKLREGVTQNIGINLVNYMTKIDTFKLVLDNKEYVESGRNEVYVIFNIPALSLDTSSGKYNIIDQDDNYISSGNWSIY